MDHLPEALRKVFVTAMDIEPLAPEDAGRLPEAHGQRGFQDREPAPHRHQEEIWQIYWLAYELGCKG